MSTVDEKDVQNLEEHIQRNPDSILFARLANAYLKTERVEDAIRLCEEGIKKHPYYTTGHFVLGKSYMADKQFEQAEKEFKRVLLFDPKYLAAHKRYGDLMREIGWENTCESSYKKILEIDPLDDVARSIAGEYVLQGSENENEVQVAGVSPEAVSQSYDSPDILAEEIAEKAGETWPQDDVPVAEKTQSPDPEDGTADLAEAEKQDISDAVEISASEDSQFKEADFDLGDLGPLPVSKEEEALMFDAGETDIKAVEDETPDPLETVDESKTDEFSYLLDDIFKDEVVEENPLGTSDDAPGDAIDALMSQTLDNGDEYDTEDDKSEVAKKQVTEVETKSDKSIDPGSIEPIVIPEPELEPAEVTERSHRIKKTPVKAPKTGSEKIVTPTLGEIYSAQGQYAKAIDVFETLLKKYPDNEVYLKKISQLQQKLSETKHA